MKLLDRKGSVMSNESNKSAFRETEEDLDSLDTASTIDNLLGKVIPSLSREPSQNFHRGNSDLGPSPLEIHEINSEEEDLTIREINSYFSKEDGFDFRNATSEELYMLLRSEPTKETFSKIGKLMKHLHPELDKKVKDDERKKETAKKNVEVRNAEWSQDSSCTLYLVYFRML